MAARVKEKRVRALYRVQREISAARLQQFVGRTVNVVCDGIDYERSCFVGRAYFQAYEIDGCVCFTAPRAETGRTYSVFIDRADAYDLYGTVKENTL